MHLKVDIILADLSSLELLDWQMHLIAEYNKPEAGLDSLLQWPLYKAVNDTKACVVKARRRKNVLARETFNYYTTQWRKRYSITCRAFCLFQGICRCWLDPGMDTSKNMNICDRENWGHIGSCFQTSMGLQVCLVLYFLRLPVFMLSQEWVTFQGSRWFLWSRYILLDAESSKY